MADVFVSYAEEDSPLVRELVQAIEAAGYTTWFYERDSLPGLNYLTQVGEQIDQARAVVLVISWHSVDSGQVAGEVVRAHEGQKHFIPLLVGMTHTEFQELRGDWRQAIGAANSVTVPEGDLASFLVRLVAGLNALMGDAPRARPKVPAKTLSAPARSNVLPLLPPAEPNPANPYDFISTAPSSMFKGREQEIAELLDAIETGTHTSIWGLQRIGKTSLVEHAVRERIREREALRDRVLFASVSLHELGSQYVTYRDLFTAVILGITEGLRAVEDPRPVEEAVERLLDKRDYQRGSKRQMLTRCESIFEAIAARATKRIVVFLDEFSELCGAIARNEERIRQDGDRESSLYPHDMSVDVPLMRWFSALLKNSSLRPKLTFIFAVRPFVAEFEDEYDLQILKLTKPIHLYYLDPAGARSLITDPLKEQIEYDDESVEYLCELTAGHPYLLQFILREVVDRARRQGRRTVRAGHVRQVEEAMLVEGPAFAAHFRVLDSDYSIRALMDPRVARHGRATLALIAEMESQRAGWVQHGHLARALEAHGLDKEEIWYALDHLVNAKIVLRREVDGNVCYRVSIPLLRKRYVRQGILGDLLPRLRR